MSDIFGNSLGAAAIVNQTIQPQQVITKEVAIENTGNINMGGAYKIPTTTGGAGQVLSYTTAGGDLIWTTPSGAGDVIGPASVTLDGNVAVFNGLTGKLLKDSALNVGATEVKTTKKINVNNLYNIPLTSGTAVGDVLTWNGAGVDLVWQAQGGGGGVPDPLLIETVKAKPALSLKLKDNADALKLEIDNTNIKAKTEIDINGKYKIPDTTAVANGDYLEYAGAGNPLTWKTPAVIPPLISNSTSITFDKSRIHQGAGVIDRVGLTGALTFSATNAVKGLIVKVYHNDTGFTFLPASGFVYSRLGNGNYKASSLNVLYFEYAGVDALSNIVIEWSVVQETI